MNHKQDTLIVIDELPLFLGRIIDGGKNVKEVEFLLSWFRSIRQSEESSIRWLFCGSVGLKNFTHHYGISHTINDLVEFELGQFCSDEAIGLLTGLCNTYNVKIDSDTAAKSIALLKWPIPYFIQLIVDKLINSGYKNNPSPLDIDAVRKAFIDLSTSDYFITWSERLDEYRDLEIPARRILNTLCLSERGLTKDNLLHLLMKDQDPSEIESVKLMLAKILDMIEHDGYLIRNKSYRSFRSPLLSRWWKYKFVD